MFSLCMFSCRRMFKYESASEIETLELCIFSYFLILYIYIYIYYIAMTSAYDILKYCIDDVIARYIRNQSKRL